VRRRASPALLVGLGVLAVALACVVGAEWSHRRAARAAREAHGRLALDALLSPAPALLEEPSTQADLGLRELTATMGLRATLITVDGRVHADSWTPPGLVTRLANQLGRPEIEAARRGQVGVARRRLEWARRPSTLVAQAIGPPEHPVGYLRVALEEPPSPWPWGGVGMALAVALVAGALAEAWARRRHSAVVRHLLAWSDLPRTADLETVAAEADRRFRATREALARELDATRGALARVAEGVVLLDREGLVRFANPAAARLLGPALGTGRPLIEAIRAPDVLAAVRETMTSGETRHTGAAGAGGAEMVVRVCALEHPTLAVVVILRDVREERQLERARRALVADLAHELRTPLTVLSGLAEEFAETGSNPEVVATLARQVGRLRTFAEDLEELARIESGQLRLRRDTVDAALVARHVAEELAPSADGAGITLVVEGGSARLPTDEVRLAQVLTNLVDNGIRYNRRGGHVTVRAARVGSDVRIDVEDDGIGIPVSEIGLVFQRFYQVRRRSAPEGGSGLGLAIVKHLVHALGGTVSLASREGAGTTVTVLLPAGDVPS
jgi:two-component system phosphate regulon sensor histidine kinase PhoR